MEETIRKMKLSVDRLTVLLSDPHPGLPTWLEAVDREIENLIELSAR